MYQVTSESIAINYFVQQNRVSHISRNSQQREHESCSVDIAPDYWRCQDCTAVRTCTLSFRSASCSLTVRSVCIQPQPHRKSDFQLSCFPSSAASIGQCDKRIFAFLVTFAFLHAATAGSRTWQRILPASQHLLTNWKVSAQISITSNSPLWAKEETHDVFAADLK